MLRDFVIETVTAPGSGATITLPGVAPTGRITWAAAFVTSQVAVFYVLDDSLQQEWGVGVLTVGAPSTITRPTVVMGNSAGTTARLTFASATRCYTSLPSAMALSSLGHPTCRNVLMNPKFDIQQRGAGPFNASSPTTIFTADRWAHSSAHATGSYSDTLVVPSDAMRTAIGDEDAGAMLQTTFTGGSGTNDFDIIRQSIENVRLLAGKQVTASFYAVASSGTPKVALELGQQFGLGGSPSAQVFGIGMTAFTLSTTWTRYVVTFTVPTAIGKTIGTTVNSHFTEFNLWLSAGSFYSGSRAGSIGVQAATISFWGCQLEIGPAPTPVEKRPQAIEFAMCQRHYQTSQAQIAAYTTAGGIIAYLADFPVVMRATPTVAIGSTVANTNASGVAVNAIDPTCLQLTYTATITGGTNARVVYTATADI